MESLNRMAVELVDEAIDFADELGVAVHELDNEATVLDFGVEVESGVEAGLLLAEIQTAGLATVQARMGEVGDAPRQYVELTTDRPGMALLASQKAGWELSVGDFEGLGSGPARAQVAEEGEFDRLGYRDDFDLSVLAVESTALPDEAVAAHVADLAGVDPGAVFLPAYAAGSVAGSVAGAARTAELAAFRLSELGYDPTDLLTAAGTAPVVPVTYDEPAAIARTTEAVTYGGRAHLQVREGFERFEEVAAAAATEHGRPLSAVFESVDWEFADLSPAIFGPAAVTVDVVGGRTVTHGETREDVLAESFGD
ncbi:MAG: methenyltetrahydromethanopterin cyclohydrolase [Halobacteriales archaeon]